MLPVSVIVHLRWNCFIGVARSRQQPIVFWYVFRTFEKSQPRFVACQTHRLGCQCLSFLLDTSISATELWSNKTGIAACSEKNGATVRDVLSLHPWCHSHVHALEFFSRPWSTT